MYFIGSTVMLLGIFVLCYLKDIPVKAFLNPSAIVIVSFTVAGIIVSTAGFKTFIKGLNAAISANYSIDDGERHKAIELFRLLSKSVIWASFISLLVSLLRIPLLQIDTAILIHAFVASLVCPVFGLTLSLVFFEPAVYILKNRR